jgi:hypothetical protein
MSSFAAVHLSTTLCGPQQQQAATIVRLPPLGNDPDTEGMGECVTGEQRGCSSQCLTHKSERGLGCTLGLEDVGQWLPPSTQSTEPSTMEQNLSEG